MSSIQRPASQLRRDALRIWQAGVDAVRSERLVGEAVRVEDDVLHLADDVIPLDTISRIAVVGGGKAGAGMAAAVERALGPELIEQKRLTGWLNVPADCVRELERITLHAARPAGVNEPRPEGAEGTVEILRIVESLTEEDLCLCLISGGGSALLPAPVEGISLDDKLAVTRGLSAAGADITELNTVRKQLSRIKGGGLARACRAGRLVAMIISDVLGDPLRMIASGPTVPDDRTTPSDALDVLNRYNARQHGVPESVFRYLESRRDADPPPPPTTRVSNHIIGNNATAVDAAGVEAERLGYNHAMLSSTEPEGLAEDVGRHLAEMALHMRGAPQADNSLSERPPQADNSLSEETHPGATGVSPVPGFPRDGARGLGWARNPASNFQPPASNVPNCLITGGEPVVRLVEKSRRGLGGRNQQLVLAALALLQEHGGADRIALLSGGTDGEDGPTDAAGAVLDAALLEKVQENGLEPDDFLARNDAYHFFEPLDGLIKTGPTNTNVCDLRVVVVDR